MPIKEKPKQSAKYHFSDVSSTREYAITGCATRTEALLLARAYSPAFDIIDEVQRFRDTVEVKEFGGGCWDATVNYVKNPDHSELNIDIGGGSIKTTVSKETVRSYGCAQRPGALPGVPIDPPNFAKGVGYNGTGFDGVDVEVPNMEFSVSKRQQFSAIDGDYIATLFRMCQTVNSDVYQFTYQNQVLIFPRGSLRFRGARIKQILDGTIDVTYNFAFSRGLTVSTRETVEEDSVELGNVITFGDDFTIGVSEPIEREGWQYLWVYYSEVTEAGRVIKKPVAAYVEKVYEYSDFTALLLA